MRGNRADSQLHGVTKEIKCSQEAGLICYLGENGMLFQLIWLKGQREKNSALYLKKDKLF